MSIFETDEELFNLFEEPEKEETKDPTNSLFSDDDSDEDTDPDDPEKDVDDAASVFSDDDGSDSDEDSEDDDEEKEKVKSKRGRKPKDVPTPYGEAIKTLVENLDEFLVYEGEEERVDYNKNEFVELLAANIDNKVEKYVNGTLENIINSFSPGVQKVIKAELKGVKVKDIIEDIREYEEIENLPENPTNEDKEFFVKKFYKELAKEKGKNEAWVTKQVERIIDGDDLDDEFEDAKKHFEKTIEERIEAKAKEKQKKEQEKIAFKQAHAHFVGEVLKEDEIYGIKLDKKKKDFIASTLASFQLRKTDNKEKMGLTAYIDQLIHAQDKKSSYQQLALMSLVAVDPKGVIEALKNSAQTEVTKDTVKQLKVADKSNFRLAEKKKTVSSVTRSIFG